MFGSQGSEREHGNAPYEMPSIGRMEGGGGGDGANVWVTVVVVLVVVIIVVVVVVTTGAGAGVGEPPPPQPCNTMADKAPTIHKARTFIERGNRNICAKRRQQKNT